jgi:hypothetical protein
MIKNSLKPRNVIPILIVLLLVFTMIWVNAMLISNNNAGPIPPPPGQASMLQSPTQTPFPQEIIMNREMTREIILVGVLLVMIIIGGTLSIISRK